MNESNIDRGLPLRNEPGNLGQEDWRIVCHPTVDSASQVAADEKGVAAEIILEPCIRVRSHSESDDMN